MDQSLLMGSGHALDVKPGLEELEAALLFSNCLDST